MGQSNNSFEKEAVVYSTGIPLQASEDHLGRILGREVPEDNEGKETTWNQERDLIVDDDDEALLAEKEVENAEDDVIDADNDDAIRSNNLTPAELSDSTRNSDLLSTENVGPGRAAHIVSPADHG